MKEKKTIGSVISMVILRRSWLIHESYFPITRCAILFMRFCYLKLGPQIRIMAVTTDFQEL